MYAIMRHEKLKSGSDISGSSRHTTRENETPNADPSRSHLNRVIFGAANPAAELDKRIWQLKQSGIKMRSDAIKGIEFFIGASPEFFEKHPERKEDFYRQSVEWLQTTFGVSNVISVISHEDESTPHLAAYVIPIDKSPKPKVEGKKQRGGNVRLNAHKWIGTPKLCSRLQTSYAKSVENLGLERGIEGSKAEHKEVKKYYGLINKAKALTGLSDALLALEEIERLMKSKKELSEQLQKLKDELESKSIEVQQIKASLAKMVKEGDKVDELMNNMLKSREQMNKNFDFALTEQVIKEGESVYGMLDKPIIDYKGYDYAVLHNMQSVRYIKLRRGDGEKYKQFAGKYYVVTKTDGKLHYKDASMTQVMQEPAKLERKHDKQITKSNGPKMGGM